MVGFIIIGNGNAVTYKEIFPYIKNNELWIGAGKGMGGKAMEFYVNADTYDASKGSVNRIENGKCYVGVMMCTWFTNVPHNKRNTPLDLFCKYNEIDYPKYDNYNAIEVSRVENIPMDYDGVMGVPISFLDKYCPTQFEIVGCVNAPFIGGKCIYKRILIRRKKNEEIVDGKKFLIIGNQNAVTYKEIFPLLKDNKMWWGTDCVRWFIVTEKMGKTTKISYNGETIAEGDRSRWFTNIPHNSRNIELDLYKKYSANEYPKYDNYDAIEVNNVNNIPCDYDGVMGVPITFLDKYCPTQFEIVDARDHTNVERLKNKSTYLVKDADGAINGKPTYARILIRRR